MNRRNLAVFAAAILCAAVLCASPALAADNYLRQTITNGSTQPANDLHIVFTEDVGQHEVKVRPGVQPLGHDGDGTVQSGNPRVADFAPPDTFGTVNGGGVAYLDYGYYGYKPYVDETQSYFTFNGMPLPSFVRNSLPMAITQDQFNKSTATISNVGVSAQQYFIQLWKDNDPSNLTIDKYFLPTGDSVPGVPVGFTLNPGESLVLDFGQVLPGTYLLALGEAIPLGGESYLMYAASAVVPEPATLTILALGGLGALLRRRRK